MSAHLGEAPIEGPVRLAGPLPPGPDLLFTRRALRERLLHERFFVSFVYFFVDPTQRTSQIEIEPEVLGRTLLGRCEVFCHLDSLTLSGNVSASRRGADRRPGPTCRSAPSRPGPALHETS